MKEGGVTEFLTAIYTGNLVEIFLLAVIKKGKQRVGREKEMMREFGE